MFALVVRFELHDADSAAEFDALVAETGEGIRRDEPGTLLYVVHRIEEDPLSRVFYELYRDRAAFDEHEQQPHTVRFLAERDQYIASLRVEFVEPVDGKGISFQ